jgi:hypothetical protein
MCAKYQDLPVDMDAKAVCANQSCGTALHIEPHCAAMLQTSDGKELLSVGGKPKTNIEATRIKKENKKVDLKLNLPKSE